MVNIDKEYAEFRDATVQYTQSEKCMLGMCIVKMQEMVKLYKTAETDSDDSCICF